MILPGMNSPTPGQARRKPMPPWAPAADPLAAKATTGYGAAGPVSTGNTGPVGQRPPAQRTTPAFPAIAPTAPGTTPPRGPAGSAGPTRTVTPPQAAVRASAGQASGGGGQPAAGFNLPDYDESKLKPLISDAEVNRLANTQINQLSTGADDAVRDLEMRLAGTGAVGGLAERAAEIRAGTGAAAAGIRGDVQTQARTENARHKLDQIDRILTRRAQDIDLTTEKGRQELSRYLGDLSAATTGRGQDMDWLANQLDALVANRGLDVTQRDQDLRYQLGTREQDVRQRGDELSANVATRGQDVERDRAVLQSIASALGIDADLRGQDIQAMIQQLRNQMEDARYQQQYALDRANFGFRAAEGGGGRIY